MIWAPFVLALLLGVIVSAGLYVAYLWPAVEPLDPDEPDAPVDVPDDARLEPPVEPPHEAPAA